MKQFLLCLVCTMAMAISPANRTLAFITQPDTVPGLVDVSLAQPYPPLDSILRRPNPERSVYGLYAWHWELNWYYDSLKAIGLSTVRMANEDGRDLDGAGPYAGTDQTFKNMVRSNIEYFYTVAIRARNNFASDDEFLAAYLTHVDTIITRYGPNGRFFTQNPGEPYRPLMYYELWNEPNGYYLWQNAPTADVAHLYARMLVQVYAHVKAKWPTVKIIGFCTDGGNQNDVGWGGSGGFIQMVHADTFKINGRTAANSYDILTTHPYSGVYPIDAQRIYSYWVNYSLANSVHEIRRVMRQYRGSEAPIWYSEGGWNRDEVGERLQAAYVVRWYLFSMRMAVDRLTVMFAKDADGYPGGFFYDEGGRIRLRENAAATRVLSRLMPNPKVIGAISDGANGYYCMKYKADAGNTASDTVIAAWHTACPQTVDIPVSAGNYTLTDMLGDTRQLTTSGPTVSIPIGPCPVYLVKNGSAADVNPPTVSSITTFGARNRVVVIFDEPVERIGAETAGNYMVSIGAGSNPAVGSASLAVDNRTVTLTMAGNFYIEGSYTLRISNIRDRATAPNTVIANTPYQFAYWHPGRGLNAQYFNTRTFTTPVVARVDSQINFTWAANAPASGVNSTNYSVRWNGFIRPPISGSYKFSIDFGSCNGVNVYINNNLLYGNDWGGGSEMAGRYQVYLAQDRRWPVTIECFDRDITTTRNAWCKLSWESPQITKQIVNAMYLYPDTTLSTDIHDLRASRGSIGDHVRIRSNPCVDRPGVLLTLQQPTQTRITVYALNGQPIKIMADRVLTGGSHTFTWDGIGPNGQKVKGGFYAVKVELGTTVLMKPVLLLQ